MLLNDKKIAIIGGGPGGLTLAKLLQLKGAEVNVYERDVNRHVRVQGSTLDLHEESGLAALAKAGLMEAFKANYRPGADKMRIISSKGEVLYDQHTETSAQDFGDEHFRPEIDRGPLRELMLDALEPGTVIWNSQLKSLEAMGKLWQLGFQDGTQVTVDVVIGADGANSKVRPYITPIKPVYSGVFMVEGTIYNSEKTSPKIHELLKGGKLFVMGDSKTLIVSSKGGGDMSFYTGCKTNELWVTESGLDFKDKGQLLKWFKQEYASWGELWHELFEDEHTTFIPRPQYYMPLDQTWEAQSNITLIGDAAHVMPPFAGEGVNMAMQDALELSECLTNSNFADLTEAIRHYEDQMRLRASNTAQLTLEQTEVMHSPNALEHMLAFFS